MKKGLTEIICILDRSGSMSNIIDDSIGGLNEFLDKQRELPGEARVTIVLFDNDTEILYNNMDIKYIPKITKDVYYPRGMTALYDAMCKTVDDVGVRLRKTRESQRPEKVIVVVITDGQENASRYFKDVEMVREKVTHQTEKYSWNFVFLAANQDAFSSGAALGISGANILNYRNDSTGTYSAYSTITNYVSSARGIDDTSNLQDLSSYVPKDAEGVWK